MSDRFFSSRDVTDPQTRSSLIRLKRTTRDEHASNDNEEMDTACATRLPNQGSVHADPMQEALACRKSVAELKLGYHDGLYAELGRIPLIARNFERDEKAWARFVSHRFWETARPQNRPHIESNKRSKIAFVTRFVFKARRSPQLKLTSKYSGVLEHLIADGVKPEGVAKALKKHKIEKTHRRVTRKPRPSERKNKKPTDSIDIVEKRSSGNDRSSDKRRGPILRWDKKARKAMKKHNKVRARVRLDCKVMEPKDGRICLSVMGVTERQ